MKQATAHPLWWQWVLSLMLTASIVVAIFFLKEGKTGSLLLQSGITMGLLESRFALSAKILSLKNKPLSYLLICLWFSISAALLIGSFLFLRGA